MRHWVALCHLCVAALLLCSRPSWGLSAAKAVTVSPRGWHAAADAAWTRATPAALSSNQHRQRFQERSPGLVSGLPAAATTASDAAYTAEPAPAQLRPSDSPGDAAPKQAHVAQLPALPLLLLVIAAAFSAGYAVGRGQRARELAEARELAAAEVAVQQLASQAAQHAAKLQPTASKPVLGPAAGTPDSVNASAAAGLTACDPCEQHADNASMLGGTLPQQDELDGEGPGANESGDRIRDLQSGYHASAAAGDAVDGLPRSASASVRLPHPVSGLVSLTDVVPGCESSLDRPGSGCSTSGSIGLATAHTTVAAFPSSHPADGIARQAEQSAEHAQQMEQSAHMRAEQDSPHVSRSQSTAASVVLREGTHDSASRASAVVEMHDSHAEQALSAPMRHLRSGQSAAGAIAGADQLARANGATEQAWDEATVLVGAMARRLQVDLGSLSAADKIQLISVVVAAWQTFQHQSQHGDSTRLGTTANELRREHIAVVETGLKQKEARHTATAVAAGARALQRGAADCLIAGLTLMVTSCLYSGLRYGFLRRRIAACPAFGGASSGSWATALNPLEALRPARAIACWIFTTGDVMLGVLLVLGLAYGGLRSSALSQATATPLFRMVVGLGLACGVLGYVAVGKLGGNPDVWLLHWEVWIALQSLLVWYAASAQRLLLVPARARWPHWAAAGLARPAWTLTFAVLVPLSAGLAPFGRSVPLELRHLLWRASQG